MGIVFWVPSLIAPSVPPILNAQKRRSNASCFYSRFLSAFVEVSVHLSIITTFS